MNETTDLDTIDAEKKAVQPSVMGFSTGAFNSETHVGLAIDLEASGKISTLTIPDVTGVAKGESPVFITKPIAIKGANLTKFLAAKKIDLPEQIKGLIGTTTVTLGGFYFRKGQPKKPGESGKNPEGKGGEDDSGVLLFSFEVQFTKGVLGPLLGDESISELFDVKAGYVRVLKSSKADLPVLKEYVKGLADE